MFTPMDLANIQFKKTLGGYSREDVDEFFALLRTDYENLYKENIALKDKNLQLERDAAKYKEIEDTMHNALLLAQSTADEVKRAAADRAEAIIKEAEAKAEEIISKARQSVLELQLERDELQNSIKVFVAKANALIKSQLEILNQMSTEGEKTDGLQQNS